MCLIGVISLTFHMFLFKCTMSQGKNDVLHIVFRSNIVELMISFLNDFEVYDLRRIKSHCKPLVMIGGIPTVNPSNWKDLGRGANQDQVHLL